MDAYKVERFGDFGVVEDWFGIRKSECPGDDSDGYKVVGIVLADGGGELVDPLCGDLLAGAFIEVERNSLHKVLTAKLPEKPIGFGLIAREDRFVHEVVTENGVGVIDGFCDSDPEISLGFPAIRFGEFVIPERDVFFVITAKSC